MWAWWACTLPVVRNLPFYSSGLMATNFDRRLSTASNIGFVKQEACCAHKQSQRPSLLWNGDILKSAKIWHFARNCPFSQIRRHNISIYYVGDRWYIVHIARTYTTIVLILLWCCTLCRLSKRKLRSDASHAACLCTCCNFVHWEVCGTSLSELWS